MGGTRDEGAKRPATTRAEAQLTQMGERLGVLAGDLGQRFRVLGARAREEGEHMWAEARSMRRKAEARSMRRKDGS
jgi:hypothetical protein